MSSRGYLFAILGLIAFWFLLDLRADEIKPVSQATVPLTSDQIAAVQALTVRAEKLAQEARAVEAERKVVQMEYERLINNACDAAGGKNCSANVQAADPKQWTLTVPPVVGRVITDTSDKTNMVPSKEKK